MARPIKFNADYFPHDSDMRNDPRVKAIRRKFGLEGYAIYVMMIEFLTDCDYFQFQEDSITVEIVAGDFDISPEKLMEILNYCQTINLFQKSEDGLWGCVSLNDRLIPLLSKRKRDRGEVIDSENTHSKVKESKEEKTKVNESKDLAWFEKQFDELFLEQMALTHKGKDIPQAIKESFAHLGADGGRLLAADNSDCKKLLNTWLGKMKAETLNGKNVTRMDITHI